MTGLPSFGAKLKQEREKRKISLEQISLSTKIGTRMLQALEEDKFNQLPGGIFNKGFVRAYSRVVGLDEDQTVADYMQASGDAPPVPTEIVPRTEGAKGNEAREQAEKVHRLEVISDTPPRQLPWGWFAAVLLLVALALSVWTRGRREHEKQQTNSGRSVAASASYHEGSGAPSGNAANGGTETSPVTSSNSNSQSPDAHSSYSNQSPVAPTTPAAPGEFTVALHAHEESWVSASADGHALPSELLPAGSERLIRATKKITVKLGNSGGVEVRLNGKKVETGGDFGEVKILTLGPTGLLPNPVDPTATP